MGLFETMMKHARDFAMQTGHSGRDVAHAAVISPRERDLRDDLGRAVDRDDGARRFDLLFSGDVQGVGFRWTNQGLARERHLTGWVRNLPDGTVRMEIQGPPRALAAHLERIHAYYARFGNRIWLESCSELPTRCDETEFDVRY